MDDKKLIRHKILNIRDNLSLEERKKYDEEIFNKVIESKYYKNAKNIFVFVSYKTEVDTHKIIEKGLEDGKIICVPKVISKKDGMHGVIINKFSDLKPGKYGILEPDNGKIKILEKEIDLVLVPGAVFDKEGGRIGYGGGFYDRFLVKLRENVPKVAIAYNVQIIDKVPMDALDVRIDDIISNG